MKIEPKDHAPKPLTKRFGDVKPGEFFWWDCRLYRNLGGGVVLCIDNFSRHDWSMNGHQREVEILDPPTDECWMKLLRSHFTPRMIEPEAVPVREMERGQPFVLPILLDGVVNGRFICGDHGSMTRLSDGKVYVNMVDCRGIPINGKFVEEDQPQ